MEFIYLVFTRMPGESNRGRLGSLALYLCDVIRALINSLVFWLFCTSREKLVLRRPKFPLTTARNTEQTKSTDLIVRRRLFSLLWEFSWANFRFLFRFCRGTFVHVPRCTRTSSKVLGNTVQLVHGDSADSVLWTSKRVIIFCGRVSLWHLKLKGEPSKKAGTETSFPVLSWAKGVVS